jgi:NADH-quinone oxidoreductase subunit L
MVNATESDLLRWIPLLPLLAALYHGVMIGMVRRATPRWVTVGLSCGSVLGSFLIACTAFGELLDLDEGSRVLVDDLYTWIGGGVGSSVFTAEMAFLLDPLAAVMTLIVTGVGFLIHVYSVGYMDEDDREDKGFQRFFCYMNLFTFSMLVLVLGDNLVLMFLGWEGVGLCSYLLIGFWYTDRHNAYCGSKAFIVNRIGDVGFLIGVFLLFAALSEAGTPAISFVGIQQHFAGIAEQRVAVPAWMPYGPEWSLANLIGLCFFLGACGKSAQLPLYTWLPDAMAGPTPVSALIHAATMVTAGVYMVCRMSFIYAAAPEASMVIAWTGAITALLAATIATCQTDIKKVLAYSTVSQLGYMFIAVGCGAYQAAIFHVGTHAFFKALLFLGAGSVILAMHHEQDVMKMGGLRRRVRQTHAVFLIGVLAIAGAPGLAGFFSKDSILVAAWAADIPGRDWLYGIALGTASLTAFYMFRLHFLVFAGECRAEPEVKARIHEPRAVILQPLWILAFFSVVSGLVGLPQAWGDLLFNLENSNSLANFLAPSLVAGDPQEIPHTAEYMIAGSSILASGLGLLGAWWLYARRPEIPGRIAAALPSFRQLLFRGYYIDELYNVLLVRPLVWISDRILFRFFDTGLIDGIVVNGSARAVRALAANGLKYAHSGLAQAYIFLMIVGAVAIVGYLVR